MVRKREFEEFERHVRGELAHVREQLRRLDDPAVGLSALHGETARSGLRLQELVQAGVTELRKENREVRSRQDRLIGELHEARSELRDLRELTDALRAALPRPRAAAEDTVEGPEGGEWPDGRPEGTPGRPPAHPGTPAGDASGHGPGAATPDHRGGAGTAAPEPAAPGAPSPGAAASDTAPAGIAPADTAPAHANADQQGETMESTHPHPHPSGDGGDLDHRALRNAVEAAYRGADTPTATASAAPPASPDRPGDPRVAHGVLLLKAAGVATVELLAHRDTWEWLAALAADHDHFRTPPAVEDVKEGRVRTVLSGRSLIAVLIKLWATRADAAPLEANWAMATTAYHRVADGLADVTGRGQTVRIVLDDGSPHSAEG
ncbi:hypothetical protein AB0B42_27915 [Streptomyces fradiae]|uniref:hypothetical protein n=1 Tax=Streptomyces fradiae TaxID=1906 RepID=UPI003405D195